jgi:hypothetical protein
MLQSRKGHATTDLHVDAHVHVYPCMSIAATLDAAARHLVDGHAPPEETPLGVLLVADPENVHGWERLADSAGTGRWRRLQADGSVATFGRGGRDELAAVRGQQLVSREGLEVLGTGCRERIPSGLPLQELVARIRAAGGLAILAWGVGKWLGRRGRIVDGVIAREAGRGDVMLADNAGRPRLWSRVPQFEAAAERGMRVLAGTDPLPLPGEERRIGSYGFRVRVPVARNAAVQALGAALARRDVPIEIVGRRVAARDFVARQLRFSLRRREAP